MSSNSTPTSGDHVPAAEDSYPFDNWFDPIEAGLRDRVRGYIEAILEGELGGARARSLRAASGRPRRGRSRRPSPRASSAHADGNLRRDRDLGARARFAAGDVKTTEWRSKALRAYQRRTRAADALIASAYLAGTNTRRVRRALAALFGGAISKDTVSRIVGANILVGGPLMCTWSLR